MAAITVTTVVNEVKAAFPDADTTSIVGYMNKVDRKLATKIRLRTNTLTLTLTAGDDTYALSDSVVRIYSARYERSSTRSNSYTMTAEDISGLDLKFRNWQSWANAEPRFYALDTDSAGAFEVRLAPAPITSTSGSYPNVKLYCSIGGTLTSGGDLPAKIQNTDVYRFGACYHYANDHRKEEATYWLGHYEKALQEELTLEFNRMAQKKPEIYVQTPQGGTY